MRKGTAAITKNFLMTMNRVERHLAKFDKTFTQEFPVLGEMTGKGTSKKACTCWDRIVDFLFWKDVRVLLLDVSTQADADARVRQYALAVDHAEEIMADLEAHPYVKAFEALGMDVLKKDDHPCISIDESLIGCGISVNVFYTLSDGYVDLTIKDGKLIRVMLAVGTIVRNGM